MHAQEQNHAVHYRTYSLWCDSPSLQQTKEPSVLSSSFKLDRSHLKHMQLWRGIKSTFCVPYVLGVLASLVMDPLGKLTTATNQETYCNCPPRLAQLPHDHWRNTNKSKPQTQRIPMESRSLIALCREVSHGKCTPKPQNERRFVRATSFLKLWIRWPQFFFVSPISPIFQKRVGHCIQLALCWILILAPCAKVTHIGATDRTSILAGITIDFSIVVSRPKPSSLSLSLPLPASLSQEVMLKSSSGYVPVQTWLGARAVWCNGVCL